MLTPQVQAISSAKRDSLSVAQQEAIKSVIERDPDEQDPWGPDYDDGDFSGSFAFHSFYDTLRLLHKFEPLYGYLRTSFSSQIIHKMPSSYFYKQDSWTALPLHFTNMILKNKILFFIF